MGIIEKQATRNAIYSYLGAGLGFITVMWMSHTLKPDENGLTRLLVSLAGLFSQFAGLGINAVTARFFPYFRNKEKSHHGYLFYAIVFTAVGFVLACICFFFLRPSIISSNQERSKLIVDYLFYLMPLTLFALFFNLFDYYLRSFYSSVIGSSSKEFTQRVLILLVLGMYFFQLISFPVFIFLYVTAICIPTLILIYYIVKLDEWHIKPVRGFASKELRWEIVKLSFFSILSGSASLLISNIDLIMVNQQLGLNQTGIYSIAFYFGTIIIIPSRSLTRIATSIIAEAFSKNDMKAVASLYTKSCNNQLAIGSLLFIGIWSNLNNILTLLPPEYASGKNVILFIGLGYLVDMATGINTVIVNSSRYYRYDTYFIFFTLVVTVLSNYFLIPVYGITGSAIATAIAISSYNILRWLLLYVNFGFQPYDRNTVMLLVIAVVSFLPGYYLPAFTAVYLDILVRSSIVAALFVALLLKTNAAPDLNNKIRKNLLHLRLK